MNRTFASQTRGAALVITLVMLSIITFITVAFLLVARRERSQVTQAANLTMADVAVNTARERAIGEVMANIVNANSMLGPSVLVSTNYDVDNANLVNLRDDPRAPVVVTETGGTKDHRFYLDLNRNRVYDPNEPEHIGDPEWIGVSGQIGAPHSGDNRFLYRYAYLALPVGKMLDLNAIHNQAKRPSSSITNESFLRNQGIGSWEINLAGFFAGLNTNIWLSGWGYDLSLTTESRGTAFEDALSLTLHRYNRDYRTGLKSASLLFGPYATNFLYDHLDSYGNGPIQTVFQPMQYIDLDALLNVTQNKDDITLSWPGSPSINRYFTPFELFDIKKSSQAFISRLDAVGRLTNSLYDATTFYRLLEQMGTDTVPVKETDHVNLNYHNLKVSATNMLEWNATDFFMATADRLMRARSNEWYFGITNIMVYPTNYYSLELHQVLQMTANIYDATRSNAPSVGAYIDYPTTFRPIFGRRGQEVYLTGYREQVGISILNDRLIDLNSQKDRELIPDGSTNDTIMAWGIPLLIGARKGYPNFNEFSLQTYVQATRKLQLRRLTTNSPPVETNQMWVLGISNVFGIECWNSYTSSFPRQLELRAGTITTFCLTNENKQWVLTNVLANPNTNVIAADTWFPGLFKVPVFQSTVMMSNLAYITLPNPAFIPLVPYPVFDRFAGFPTPQWGLSISNKLFLVMIDSGDHIVDYVNMEGLDSYINLTEEMIANRNIIGEPSVVGNMWNTNRVGNGPAPFTPTYGIMDQMEVSRGRKAVSATDWRSYNDQASQGMDKDKAIDQFLVFLGEAPIRYPRSQLPPSGLYQQAPFSPTRKLYVHTSWQVNDPLVHYHVGDLLDPRGPTNTVQILKPPTIVPTNSNIGRLNERYRPWAGNPQKDPTMDTTAYNYTLKDPGVRKSDDWDFPRSKFPSIGWLGRVHRGTPWQTIYLKSEVADQDQWARWAHSPWSHPTNDWSVADIFSASPHPETTRGLLPINQTGYAAWSALLSGVLVAKPAARGFQDVQIEPNSDEFRIIYDGIMATRNNWFSFAGGKGKFERVSNLLAVPAFTVMSPYLSQMDQTFFQRQMTDAAYERIPERILSLLRVDDPRYVIYAWGQSLRPARGAIMAVPPSSQQYRMSTNYVVTGEVASRTLVRIENVSNVRGTVRPRAVIESYNLLPPD